MPVDNMIVKIDFDPWANPITAAIFSNNFTRNFYLLWRRDHLVSNEFPDTCLKLLHKWRLVRPAMPQEMISSIPRDGVDFSDNDIRNFVAKYDDYLFGSCRVGYQIGNDGVQG